MKHLRRMSRRKPVGRGCRSKTYNPGIPSILNLTVRAIVKFALLFCASAPSLFVCWMIFVGTFDEQEMLIGMAVSVVSAVAICVVEYANEAHFRPRLRDVAQVVFVPWLFLQGTYEILLVSVRDLLGGKKAESDFRLAEFDSGDTQDPHDTGRRVLAVGYTTMAPNFIVLGINSRERRMLFHQIEKSPVPRMTKNLGAEA